MRGFIAASITGTGAGGGRPSRKPRIVMCSPSRSTRSPASTLLKAGTNSRVNATAGGSVRPCHSSTVVRLPRPSPARTRPGASEARLAKPIASSGSERVVIGTMPVPTRARVSEALTAASSANTSGPETSPASTVW